MFLNPKKTIMKKNNKGEEKLSQTSLVQYINQDLKVFIEKDLFIPMFYFMRRHAHSYERM